MPTNEQRRQAAKRKLERQLVRRAERARRRRTVAVSSAVIIVLALIGGIVWLVTRGTGGSTPTAAASDTPAATSAAPPSPITIPTALATPATRPTPLPPTATCAYPAAGQAAKPAKAPNTANIPATGTIGVALDTSVGAVNLTLNRALAPCTANSFVSLAGQGYFDQTSCHRLTTGDSLQVLQCGDPSGSGSGGPGYSFKDETFPQLTYGRGLLAMANSGPDTNGSQFFIVYGNAQLPANYTVFGTVDADSLGRIDTVARAGVQGGGDDGAPATKVTVTKATVAR